MVQKPKVVVGTLTWNQKERVFRWFESISKLDYPGLTLVVVDNHSTDGTVEALRQSFPEAHVIRHRENLGFGEGINSQFRFAIEAGADYLFIVENDGEPDPKVLSLLVEACERNPRIGAAFPRVFYADQRDQIWPVRGTTLEEMGSEITRSPLGICLIRMEAVKKAGYLDPGYFIFFDDADWLLRLSQAGYVAQAVPETRAWHGPPNERCDNLVTRTYYQTRNRLYFVQKYVSPVYFLRFFFSTFFKTLLWALPACLLRGKQEAFRGMGWGWIDFLKGKRGRREFALMKENIFRRRGQKILDGCSAVRRKIRFWLKRGTGNRLKIRVRIDWNIGDEVIASPVYQGLKEKYPRSVIDAEVRYPELVEGNPFVDSVNAGKSFDPDLVVNLHQEVRNRPRTDYLSGFAGLEHWTLPKVYVKVEEIQRVKKKWFSENSNLRVVICPEVGWLAKRWLRENWIRLAEYFIKTHRAEVWVSGKDGRPLPVGTNLIGQTTLREMAAFLTECHLFVGNDSGPLYLAVAVGTPAVGLYGPLDPSLLYPKQPHFIPVYSEVECRGCWPDGRMKYPDHCPKVVPDCMSSIPLERVIEAAEKLLALKANLDAAKIQN